MKNRKEASVSITDFDKVLRRISKVEIIDEKYNVKLRCFSKGILSINKYVEFNIQEEYEEDFRNLIYDQNRLKTVRTLKRYLKIVKNKEIHLVKNVELNYKPLII